MFLCKQKDHACFRRCRDTSVVYTKGIISFDELAKWNRPVRLNLKDVGRSLHDHYDIGTSMIIFPRRKGYVDFNVSDLLKLFVKSKGTQRPLSNISSKP